MDGKEEVPAPPFFSVIVPTYNNGHELTKCIGSILGQSYTDFELILIDDGSTDETPGICDRFAQQDKRVKVIHKRNEGAAAARNEGLFHAAGKYVGFVDGDDWIAKQLLKEAAQVLDSDDPPDIFIFGYSMIQENGQSVSYLWPGRSGLYSKEQLEKEVYPNMYRTGITMRMGLVSGSLGDKIIARKLLMEHCCKEPSLFIFEDLVCAYECVYHAKQVYFSSQNMYFYNRFSASSMHRRYHADLFENSRIAGQYLRTHIGGLDSSVMDGQINKIEFDGIVSALYQEIQFGSSFRQSSLLIKEKIKKANRFPICPMKGLKWYERSYVLLLSFRLVYLSLLLAKTLTVMVNGWKKGKYIMTKNMVGRLIWKEYP